MSHYTITPTEKKSIELVIELYREDPNTGVSQWMNISETFRWGRAFVAEEDSVNLPYADSDTAYAKIDAGEYESCEFDDSISVDFEFDDAITEDEREALKDAYYDGGMGWVHDGDHEWQIEDEYVVVYAPYVVQLCDEHGEVLQDIKLKPRPDPSTSWPFSPEFPKPKE